MALVDKLLCVITAWLSLSSRNEDAMEQLKELMCQGCMVLSTRGPWHFMSVLCCVCTRARMWLHQPGLASTDLTPECWDFHSPSKTAVAAFSTLTIEGLTHWVGQINPIRGLLDDWARLSMSMLEPMAGTFFEEASSAMGDLLVLARAALVRKERPPPSFCPPALPGPDQ